MAKSSHKNNAAGWQNIAVCSSSTYKAGSKPFCTK
jgi:hypothetical protein